MMTKTKLADLQKAALSATDAARKIAERSNPDPTTWDAQTRADYDAEMTKARDLLGQIKRGKGDLELLEEARSLATDVGMPSEADRGPDSTGHLALSGKSARALAQRIAARMTPADAMGRKALLPTGSTIVAVPMLAESPIALGRPALSLLDVLDAQARAPKYNYLRQVTRTNNAAPVADSAAKPTSVIGLEQVDAELHVVAHLSEAIPKYWLEDSAALDRFVADEMLFGLRQALEAQVFTGSGTGTNLNGLLTNSGIQVQAFATDLLTTTRRAITKLEAGGHEAGVFVLAPADWEKLELARTQTAGQLELGGPVDRAARKLWSVPVVLSLGVPAAKALLLDLSAVGLSTDNAGIETKWSENVSDDFAKNQLRARVEGRFEVDVYQPLGIVAINTA